MEIVVRDTATYYKGKRIFLTGHTGFKGSWLLLWLYSLGAIVKGYSLAPVEENNLYELIGGNELCESVINDVRNTDQLEKEILLFEPDFIFHLAAQPLVRLSYSIPKETFEVNVNGTINLLEAVRKLHNTCSVIVITTDKVYENIEMDYPYKEDDKLGGYDPYSASKAAVEIVVSSYRNSFFNPQKYAEHKKAIAVARAGNVIGGGDRSTDRIIPDIINALENNRNINVRNPNSVRPWQHVLDPLFGYMLLGVAVAHDPITFASAFNFGPDANDTLTVEQLVKKTIYEWGSGDYKLANDHNDLHEAGLLKLDNSKAKKMLGWYPQYNSELAVEKTIEWYKEANINYRHYTLSQINKYSEQVNGV